MSFSALEKKRIERSLDAFLDKRRPPPEVHDQVDLGFSIEGQSVTILEVRPDWQDPAEKVEKPVAKVTYVKSRRTWKIYWFRADMKWHLYEPSESSGEVEELDDALEVIVVDEHCCFWG